MPWQAAWDFLATHVYGVVFVGTVIDAAGIPFPGRLMLVAAGGLAASGRASLPALLALATAAASLGDHVWFVAGRLGGRHVTDRYCRLLRFAMPDCLERAAAYVERFGGLAVVLGRFTAGVRILVTPLAAAAGMPYPRYLGFDLAGAATWATLWLSAGFLAADRWSSRGTAVALAAVAIMMALAPLAQRYRRRRRDSSKPSGRPLAGTAAAGLLGSRNAAKGAEAMQAYSTESFRSGTPWAVAWSPIWVGVLAALATGLVIGLIGFALGAHQASELADWRRVRFISLVFNVAGAFFAFVAGGWVVARLGGFRRAESAVLHAAIMWALTVPLLLLLAALGGTARFGAWYGGLAAAPSWALTAAQDPRLAELARNTSLAALAALLLGLVGAVIGGWLASGEPMTFAHYRRRDQGLRAA